MSADPTTGAAVTPADDALHEAGGRPGWRERITFTFGDEGAGFGGVLRMNLFPVERVTDATINLFLPGDAIATALTKDVYAGATTVGRLAFETPEPLARWHIACRDTALVFPRATSGKERQGAAARLEIDLTFESWALGAGRVARERAVDELNFITVVSNGRIEHACRVSGSIRIGNRQASIDAGGIRERAWGSELEQTATRLGAAFDPATSLVLSGVTYAGAGRFDGWRVAGGEASALQAALVELTSEGRNVRSIRVELPGEVLRGDVVASVPIKDQGVRIQQSLVAWSLGARRAWGVAEFAG